jgi:hypothetical protein
MTERKKETENYGLQRVRNGIAIILIVSKIYINYNNVIVLRPKPGQQHFQHPSVWHATIVVWTRRCRRRRRRQRQNANFTPPYRIEISVVIVAAAAVEYNVLNISYYLLLQINIYHYNINDSITVRDHNIIHNIIIYLLQNTFLGM